MMQRRNFLGYATAIVAALWAVPKRLLGSPTSCATDSDVQGPFFRKGAPARTNLAADYKGAGRLLHVHGTVFGPDCTAPLSDARIELWHADPSGHYDLDSDKFLFRGLVRTDSKGRYTFETMIPAGYKDGPLDRPAHIHYMVEAPGHKKLVTQLYFEGDPKLEGDIFIRQNNGKKRALPYPQNREGVHVVEFNLVLKTS